MAHKLYHDVRSALDEAVRLDHDGGVAFITLARADAANSVNRDLASGFRQAVIRCEEDDVRAVVIRTEGQFFCVGGDINAFGEAGSGIAELVEDLTRDLHDGLARLARMPKPVITAVQGAAAGAGLGIALAGDLVIAARSASFRLAYSAIGLTPDAGATWVLPRILGYRRALEIALLNPKLTADEAFGLGLITRVVEDEELEATVGEMVQRLSAGSLAALGTTRKLIAEGMARSFEDQLRAEAAALAHAAAKGDGQEGIAAFLAKRRPNFAGRAGQGTGEVS